MVLERCVSWRGTGDEVVGELHRLCCLRVCEGQHATRVWAEWVDPVGPLDVRHDLVDFVGVGVLAFEPLAEALAESLERINALNGVSVDVVSYEILHHVVARGGVLVKCEVLNPLQHLEAFFIWSNSVRIVGVVTVQNGV